MRYLTIMPDYTQSCIKDDYKGRVEIEELNLPQEFVAELNNWHSNYREIIPLDDDQRQVIMNRIDQLDEWGLKLAHQLVTLVPGGAKVKYFSEGKLKYLYS